MRGGVEERRTGSISALRGSGSALGSGMEPGGGAGKRGDACLAEIQRLERNRADRRKLMEKARADRVAEEARNIANGNPGDVDFVRMIQIFRDQRAGTAMEHMPSHGGMKICIAIRKRPCNPKERARKDHDAVSCFNPEVTVHDCKLRVDGISKYLDSSSFRFDYAFGEEVSTDDVYECTAKPLVPFVLNKGRATVFAYGQTGSGKTFTMVGIQRNATNDLFDFLAESPMGDSLEVYVSFFEIYGGRCQDLLNHRHRLVVREDGKGEVVIAGLEEKLALDAESLEALIADGNRNRTTHATESNDQSSRSHAICQIAVREKATNRLHGKLSLIDLAGSERGTDTKSHNRQRRMEGADINKSLLALKECIRALDSESVHVPYRASKLTLVLKDSFTRKNARTVMIAAVSPVASSADHTINTLRYADRVKENKVEQFKPNSGPAGAGGGGGGRVSPLDKPPPPPASNGAGAGVAAAGAAGAPSASGTAGTAGTTGTAGSAVHGGHGGHVGGAMAAASQSKHAERRSGPSAAGGGVAGASSSTHQRLATDFKAAFKSSSDNPELDRRVVQAKGLANLGGDRGAGGLPRRSSIPSKHQRNLSAADGKREALLPRGQGGLDHIRGGGGMGGMGQPMSLRDLRGDGDYGGRGLGGGGAREGFRSRRRFELGRDEPREWDLEDDGNGGTGGPESVGSDTASAASDIYYVHESLRQHNPEEEEDEGVVELHHTVQSLFEEEEALLSLHMSVIKENADLLTEEGMLLQQIQGENVVDYDIDAYASRLSQILDRKMELMSSLQTRLRNFRDHLEAEEKASHRLRGLQIPQY